MMQAGIEVDFCQTHHITQDRAESTIPPLPANEYCQINVPVLFSLK
jgi:hypothetical protein